MLALRDQENLIYDRQTTAASKPANQGSKQLQPKTPGAKHPKTPYKIPLNDENDRTGFGKEHGPQKLQFRGNEYLATGIKLKGAEDKSSILTPIGRLNRAPLGAKTTNARTKVFQTPNLHKIDNVVKQNRPKGASENASVQRAKLKASPAKMTEVIFPDSNDWLDEEDIEYMPPKAEDLPDFPDDIPHDIDFSVLDGGAAKPGCLHHFVTRRGADGLNHYEREQQERAKQNEISIKKLEASMLRDIESIRVPCIHINECPGDECTINVETRKAAEEKYQRTIAVLTDTPPKKPISTTRKTARTNGPSTAASKSAVMALSQTRRAASAPLQRPETKSSILSKKPTTILSRPKQALPPANPSSMRHAAAVAASNTTIGRSKGRLTSLAFRAPASAQSSDAKRNPPVDARDLTLAPDVYIERYGVPKIGSEQWSRCKDAGCFDDDKTVDEEVDLGGAVMLDEYIREEAMKEFKLEWQDDLEGNS